MGSRAGRAVRRAAALLGLAALACGGPSESPAAARMERPHVLLVTLDTTRADHLGVYGYGRDTSPHLDALARESAVYTRAYATSSWTLPSHASLFTGKYTTSHGARYDPEGPLHLVDALDGRPDWADFRARGLSPRERTLAAMLGEAGYATGAVVAGPWMKRVFGLDAGFAHYDDAEIHSVAGRPGDRVTDAALAWIDGLGERPFFLFLNYYDAHAPYLPEPEFLEAIAPGATRVEGRPMTREETVRQYDAELRAQDHHLGRLLDGLRARGLYEDTWILVTADHGELLGEHGQYGHGKLLSQPELHIPLVVKHPGREVPPGRVDTPMSLVDLLPWIGRRLDLEVPEPIQGEAPPPASRPIVAEAYPLAAASRSGHWRALLDGTHKYLWSSLGWNALFDLAADPGEETNLLAAEPERAEAMRRRLLDYLAGLPAPGEAGSGEIDAATREALESLGYIEEPASPAPNEEGSSR